MDEVQCFKAIKEAYPDKGTDYLQLFTVVVESARDIGLDKALALVSKRGMERRKAWINKNLKNFKKSDNPLDDVLNIFYKECIGIEIGKDGEIVKKTDDVLITRWWNPCPILEACKKFGLDTKQVCKKGFHTQNQFTLSSINPRLQFDRSYESGIRPDSSYCEEIISLNLKTK